jgi:hypothetical protein
VPDVPPHAEISTSDLHGRSYLLRALYGPAGQVLTVPVVCLLWAAAQLGFFVALAAWEGALTPDQVPGGTSLVEDTTALGWYALLPGCFLLLHYSRVPLRGYLNRLPDLLEPTAPPGAHAELLAVARGAFGRAQLTRPRLVFTAIGLSLFAYNAVTNFFPDAFYHRSPKWDSVRFPVSYVAARLWVLFVWGYAVPVWATEVWAQLSALIRITRTTSERGWLRIAPYAADGFGGLARLKSASAWVSSLVLVAGLFFLAPMLRLVVWHRPLHLGNYVGLGLYALCAAASAVGPVYLLHRALARKRERMLGLLAGAFDRINARAAPLVERGGVPDLADAELGRALDTADRLRAQWASLPVWPLGVGFFLKALATLAPPLVTFLWQQYAPRLVP